MMTCEAFIEDVRELLQLTRAQDAILERDDVDALLQNLEVREVLIRRIAQVDLDHGGWPREVVAEAQRTISQVIEIDAAHRERMEALRDTYQREMRTNAQQRSAVAYGAASYQQEEGLYFDIRK